MSGTAESPGGEPGAESEPQNPPISRELANRIHAPRQGEPIEPTNTTVVYLQTSTAVSPAEEFSKLPAELQQTLIKGWVDKGRHEITYENRQQKFDFTLDVLKLLLPFALGVILILLSVYLIERGMSNEGLISLAGSGFFEAFALWEYNKRSRQKQVSNSQRDIR